MAISSRGTETFTDSLDPLLQPSGDEQLVFSVVDDPDGDLTVVAGFEPTSGRIGIVAS
jgi:hypothetical protein